MYNANVIKNWCKFFFGGGINGVKRKINYDRLKIQIL